MAYAKLSALASGNGANEIGARAALVLGYYDLGKGRYAQAKQWLEQARRDAVLREYALFWDAQLTRAMGRDAQALAAFESFQRDFPASVMAEQAVQALAETALQIGKPERALVGLSAYDALEAKPALLLLRGRALEKAGRPVSAAWDYSRLYYRFPLRDEAREAGKSLDALRRRLGAEFPAVAAQEQVERAAAFYAARLWKEARAEYSKLERKLSATDRERAALRIAECRVQLRAAPAVLASISLTDPELDAERLYELSQLYRSRKREAEMLATIERTVARYPKSRWSEEALFSGGNYFWVKLDRQRAAEYYRRTLAGFPEGKDAAAANWRLAWTTYLEGRPEAPAEFEAHLRRFAGSPFTANALYWLGRQAERSGSVAHARSFYLGLVEGFPQTYYGQRASERFRALGAGSTNSSPVLALIPSPAPLLPFDQTMPPSVNERWERAQALRTIAWDAFAELELRAAYGATAAPGLLLEAARVAVDAGHYAAGIVAVRQIYPQLEARRWDEVPQEAWRTAFPLPFEAGIRDAAAQVAIDPMLVAGLIRQESIFQRDAISHAGAVGLMQVLPKSGKKLARRLRLRYSRARLLQPEYNLRLGTAYLADLVKTQSTLEAALAAYNAGEDRVAAWQSARSYAEPAEFVESIPFTETREYVQTVMRNAEIYRRLYGKKP